MRPAFRNHRVPTARDTPASTAASSLAMPAAIAAQNCRPSSRPATGGRPGERNGARPDRFERRFRMFIATSSVKVLRRPFESAQYTSEQFQRLIADNGVICSMSRSGNIWDNAAMESFFSSLKTERTAPKTYRTRGKGRRVRLHRVLLQCQTTPLDARLPQPGGVRKAGVVSLGWCLLNPQQPRCRGPLLFYDPPMARLQHVLGLGRSAVPASQRPSPKARLRSESAGWRQRV